MKKGLIIISVITTIFACSKKNDTPADLPPAIKTFTEGTTDCGCEPFVDLYDWRDQLVYVINCKGPACNCAVVYYDEEGVFLTMADGYSFDQFRADAKFRQHVWDCNHRPQ